MQKLKNPTIYLIAALIVYSVLLFPTLGRYGISWDEQTDTNIAHHYIFEKNGWLQDAEVDTSQTRLPMYFVAIIFFLLKTSSLLTARIISCFLGALTIIAVYIYCKRRYDYKRGALACFLIATSPFFLSFARIAYTESDIYISCALSWTLVCLLMLEEKKTVGWAMLAAVVLGLAISSKFTAIAVIPAVFASFTLNSKKQINNESIVRTLILGLFIAIFSLLTFMVIPPVHTTNPAILNELLSRFLAASKGLNLSLISETAALHLGSVLFKSSLVIGAWLWFSFFITMIRSRYQAESRLPLLIFVFYFAILTILIPQTFHMMPLLPILAIFASDQFFRFYEKRRLFAKVFGLIAICSLVVDIIFCYPDYNLNGFQWLGARYLWGRSTVGYRSIVQTTSDGIEQALKWANNNIQTSKIVFTYLRASHLVRAICWRPKFQIIDGLKTPQAALINADYVITSINDEIEQGFGASNPRGHSIYKYPYDRELLKTNFTKVFSVKRAFGFEVATVWKKQSIIK